MFFFSVIHSCRSQGTRILTSFPSITPTFEGLTLGPDSPFMDEPRKGIFRLSELRILTLVFVTQADILASLLSTKIHIIALPRKERSPTNSNLKIAFC